MEEYYKLGEIFRSDIDQKLSENSHNINDIINTKRLVSKNYNINSRRINSDINTRRLISNSKSINDIKQIKLRKQQDFYDSLKKHYKINQEEELI